MKAYSCIQLLTDKHHSEGADRFDIGYIIEVYPAGKYEVEFSDRHGNTTALIVVDEADLRVYPEAWRHSAIAAKQ